MNWIEVLGRMQDRYANKRDSERKGQAYFNALYEVAPNVANEIRGTNMDPFYDDTKVENFLVAIRPHFK